MQINYPSHLQIIKKKEYVLIYLNNCIIMTLNAALKNYQFIFILITFLH